MPRYISTHTKIHVQDQHSYVKLGTDDGGALLCSHRRRRRVLSSMGSFASKSCDDWCWMMRKVLQATATRRRGHGAAAVHPWTPPSEAPPPGQRVTVRMRASEFRALAAVRSSRAAGDVGEGEGHGDVARLILDGCAAGRWAWSPAPEE